MIAPFSHCWFWQAGGALYVRDDSSKLAIARFDQRIRLAGVAELVGYDPQVNKSRCRQLVHHYGRLFGALPPEGRSAWAGLRPMTPDGTPIVGATPIEGLYLNTGHGTYGWTLACGSAQLLADVVMAGAIIGFRRAPLDAADFALQRYLH